MSTNAIRFKIAILLLSLLPEAILESTLTPLFPYIVRSLGTIPEDEVGNYTGMLGSAFYFPLFLMNIVWGAASDRVGRKPILILGLIAGTLSTFTLGYSKSFWLTFTCRLTAGIFGSNSTVAKGFIGDLARDQKGRAWGYAMYGAVYGVSGIVGPIIGGLLANPAKLYPETFSPTGLFAKYPFLLITLVGTCLSLLALYLTVFFMKEDPHEIEEEEVIIEEGGGGGDILERDEDEDLIGNQNLPHNSDGGNGRMMDTSSTALLENSRLSSGSSTGGSSKGETTFRKSFTLIRGDKSRSDKSSIAEIEDTSFLLQKNLDEESGGGDTSSLNSGNIPQGSSVGRNSSVRRIQIFEAHPSYPPRDFKVFTWNTLGPIFLYCIIAYHNITYMTILPLFFSAAPSSGGLAFLSSTTGLELSLIACSKLFVQIFLFHGILGRLGSARVTFLVSMIFYLPTNLLIPVLTTMPNSTETTILVFSSVLMLSLGISEALGYLSVILMITESQVPLNLGKAHGLASTLAALARTIGPAVGGSIWEWGVQIHMPAFVFIYNTIVALSGLLAAIPH